MVYAMLSRKGHISTAYIDDSCLQECTKQECAQNVSDTVHLLNNLGFMVYDKKSVLIPTKEIIFVSFVLNSADMTVCQLNKAIFSDTEAPFLDLNLSITNGIVSSKIYDKQDDFNFEIVNFPFLMEMFLALLPMVYMFLSLFVLLECVLMLMTST